MLLTNATAFCLQSFDYLIVGGGTAGTVLARRLSADPSLRVGVIEAGVSEISNPLVTVPGIAGHAMDTEVNWNFSVTPQPELDGASFTYPRGRMVGGSSGLNYMVWGRAGKKDYDAWEELGNAGWNWDAIFEYSKKAETVQPPVSPAQLLVAPEPPYIPQDHGTDGPVHTDFTNFDVPYGTDFLPGLKALGVPANKEPMSGDNTGGFTTLSSVNQITAQRSYGDLAYIQPVVDRENLVILTAMQATKIVLDDGKVATGVQFVDRSNQTYTAHAKKEVLLSAGTVQSPQVLELSGIGRRDVLESVGIPVLVESDQVGEHFEDHPLAGATWELIPNVTTWDLLSDPAFLAAAEAEYAANKSGILSGTFSHLSMLPLHYTLSPSEIAALQALAPNTTKQDQILRRNLADPEVAQMEVILGTSNFFPTTPVEPGKTYVSMVVAVLHPFAHGTIHINSSDPLAPPLINPNIWSSEIDRRVMLEAIKFSDRFANTDVMKKWTAKRVSPPDGNLTDAQWWDQIKLTTGTVYHPVGTCRLGAVVDDELKVKGVKGLRVVDASVIPAIVAAHTQLTTYAIAEKAADLILKEKPTARLREQKPSGV